MTRRPSGGDGRAPTVRADWAWEAESVPGSNDSLRWSGHHCAATAVEGGCRREPLLHAARSVAGVSSARGSYAKPRAAGASMAALARANGASGTRGAATAIGAARSSAPGTERPSWREALAPYARAHLGRSLLDIATSLVPYLALSALMYLALDVSYLLVLALAIPAAGFLLRTYIVFHDCAHGSFLPSKRANVLLGRALGLVVFTPYAKWKHDHAVHHATAGDLERRGTGDVTTWTVAEYRAKPWRSRLGYRLFRNPLVMFGLGPIWGLLLQPRRVGKTDRRRLRNSVRITNLALLAALGGLIWLVGWQAYLLVQGPPIFLAAAAGVWLFYVQHQFEDAYWESTESWSYADAALRGSSYLNLPQPLQWFSGNIGLHHVHHLSARVPNYHLQRAHDGVDLFSGVPELSLMDGLRAARLKLWDEDAQRLVTWREARPPRAYDAAATPS